MGAGALAIGILLVIPPGSGAAPAPLAAPAAQPALPGLDLPPPTSELELRRVYLHTLTTNVRAQQAFRRAGFRRLRCRPDAG